ncbi:MAG: hypothetical protein RML45_15950 [Acetobacteraceae bacterium]|nr:hypothetical protein [Acetobacteraceae bacterium]
MDAQERFGLDVAARNGNDVLIAKSPPKRYAPACSPTVWYIATGVGRAPGGRELFTVATRFPLPMQPKPKAGGQADPSMPPDWFWADTAQCGKPMTWSKLGVPDGAGDGNPDVPRSVRMGVS